MELWDDDGRNNSRIWDILTYCGHFWALGPPVGLFRRQIRIPDTLLPPVTASQPVLALSQLYRARFSSF